MRFIHGARRFFFTLKHLKFSQLFFQVYYRVFRRFAVGLLRIKRIDARFVNSDTPWSAPASSGESLFEAGRVVFLNEPGVVSGPDDWNSSNKEKLWLYNLHYFSDLSSNSTPEKRKLQEDYLRRWINDNPPYAGNGWEPYTISIRVVNLLQWISRYRKSWLELDESIKLQAEALYQQVEYHILANHIFSNAKALIFSGVFFKGRSAEKWLRRGVRLLAREVGEQFLDDGAHFERSPSYHALLLWDLCDLFYLAELSGDASLAVLKPQLLLRIKKGYCWLREMTHADGAYVQFNDSAIGVAPTLLQINCYLDFLNIDVGIIGEREKLIHHNNSGFVRISLLSACDAWLNVGSIAPSYQPGHAHAETLSFECDLFGARFIVNSGTSIYGVGPLRMFQRSTKAHSTVEVNSLDSSEVWGGFRVARRADVMDLRCTHDGDTVHVGASHDGYVRDSISAVHRRNWFFRDKSILIRDCLEGEFRVAVARYYLHPDVVPVQNEDELSINGRRVRYRCFGGSVELVASNWYPEFGVRVCNHCLEITFLESTAELEFYWD